MTFLLDTHSIIWFIEGDSKLSAPALEVIENPENQILVSIGSLWEIAIKNSLGKLAMKQPYEEILYQFEHNRIEILPIEFSHTSISNRLFFYHKDPFDRLIIAQAIAENIVVIGKDSSFDNYGTKRLW